MTTRLRQKLSSPGRILCAKSCYHDPELVELMASAGFDGIWICLEHRKLDPSIIYSSIQACRLGGSEAIIRVRPGNYTDLIWLLEAGAGTIMLPRVRSAAEVKQVLEWMKFPPVGRRGFDGIHAEANFGRLPPAEYMRLANEKTVLIVQIEEPESVEAIDEIAALEGVDVLFVGPGDLTLGMNKFGQTDDPAVKAIILQVAESCRRHGKAAGIPCSPDQVARYEQLGFRFFNVISDFRCITQGLKQALDGIPDSPPRK